MVLFDVYHVCRYVGEWLEGNQNGKGVMTMVNGLKLEGELSSCELYVRSLLRMC